ncbi:MAG: zinc ribbon domain-containing protein [Lachnospiraceae bacterium]|nr:zinc ribbon domain-containing protein [Lachnospiraceae bacterium]
MKKCIGWIIGTLETLMGFFMFIVAKAEISSNSSYTWSRPYTSYEAQVIITKWVGIMLLVSGVIWIGQKLYQAIYTNKHIQDINQLTQRGGAIKCASCGLGISASVDICPRCGKVVEKGNTNNMKHGVIRFCGKCGSQINMGESFCSKCGNKIN